MENKSVLRGPANIVGAISILIALVMLLPILNWYFKITPFQKWEGFPLLMTPFISPIGILLGFVSIKIKNNKVGKIGLITNILLFILPFAYWYIGGFIFGV